MSVKFDVRHVIFAPCNECLMAAIGAQEADGSGFDEEELRKYCRSKGHRPWTYIKPKGPTNE